tara:strand:- start:209 stop:469 length:261 start_codon:yes stop_codon:yes gene_type:complete
MIYLKLITNDELAFLINAQVSDDSFKQDSLSRSGLIGLIESIKEDNPKNMTKDSYYIIKKHIERLERFKELQKSQLNQFKEVLIKY